MGVQGGLVARAHPSPRVGLPGEWGAAVTWGRGTPHASGANQLPFGEDLERTIGRELAMRRG
jgi:hypothetical protein